MSREATGYLEWRNGRAYLRVTRQQNGVRQRARLALDTADPVRAEKIKTTYMAQVNAGLVNPFARPESAADVETPAEVDATPPAAPAEVPTPKTMPKLEPYGRAWHAGRVGKVASAPSEHICLEKWIFPANVGTEEAPLRLGDMLLGDVRPPHVKTMLKAVQRAGKKQGTVRHVRGALHLILQLAVEDGLVPENVVSKVKTPKTETREVKRPRMILSDAEIEMFYACEDADLEIRMLSVTARTEGGMRTRDLTAWGWEMLDLQRFSRCTIPRTKTCEPQELEIPAVLQAPLRRWWVAQGSPTTGPVFPVTKGKRKGDPRRARGVSFAKRLRRALMVAGIKRHRCEHPDVLPTARRACCAAFATDPLYHDTPVSRKVDFHGFRRGFKTGLAETGISTEHAMHLSGSSDPRTHARYVMQTPTMQKIPEAALPQLGRAGRAVVRVGGANGAAAGPLARVNGPRMAPAVTAPDGPPADSSSGTRGSNPRPSAWEADALPTELVPRSSAGFLAPPGRLCNTLRIRPPRPELY